MWGIGSPPFRFIAERLLREDEFRADLKVISKIDAGQLEKLAKGLAAEPHFLDRGGVAEAVNKWLAEDEAKVVRRVVTQLNQVIRESDDSADEALQILSSEMNEHSEEFPSPEVIVDRLRDLIVVPQGLARQKKAEGLADATGAELDQVGIFCDIRPVFDDERAKVEGAVLIATLRIDTSGPDGLAHVVECRLTERQLDRLYKVSDEARRKMLAMKELLASKNIPIAKTSEDGGKPK